MAWYNGRRNLSAPATVHSCSVRQPVAHFAPRASLSLILPRARELAAHSAPRARRHVYRRAAAGSPGRGRAGRLVPARPTAGRRAASDFSSRAPPPGADSAEPLLARPCAPFRRVPNRGARRRLCSLATCCDQPPHTILRNASVSHYSSRKTCIVDFQVFRANRRVTHMERIATHVKHRMNNYVIFNARKYSITMSAATSKF